MSTRRQFIAQTTAIGIAAASAARVEHAAAGLQGSNTRPADRRATVELARGDNSYAATTLWNQRVKARDGTEMAMDVLLPEGSGPFPTIVMRTPYGRGRYATRSTYYVQRGYGVALVDVRGRGDSDGTWRPLVKDVDDAYDVIEWIAAQPWCTGKIGMMGGSYDGLTQWWTAAGRPPHLTCIVPQAVGCVRESETPFSGSGIPSQYLLWWMTLVTGRTFQNGAAPSWEREMPSLPVRNLDESIGTTSSAWQTYVAGKIDDLSPDFAISEKQMTGIDVPVLIGVGWWDDQGAMNAWRALQKARSAKKCRLLIGGWDHAGNAAPRPVLGGLDMSASVFDVPAYIEKFFALHLKGENNDMAGAKRCRVFQTGTQRWNDLDDWPHPAASEVSLYLSSTGDARSLRGTGRLGRDRPRSGAGSDRYTYDPNNPARDITNMAMFAWSDPPLDNRYLLRRKDVLVYDTDVLTQPVSISGRVRYELFLSSDRVDTDLFIDMCDVHPDGRSVVLGGGCSLRLSYRDGPKPELLKPGEIVQLQREGNWLHHVLLPDHRLRVVISSNGFPSSVRNAGTGEFWADATVLLPQTNTLHHGAKHRSRVLLPVVSGEKL